MNIILLGYMGCGKSTVGRELAQISDMDFIDFDSYLEEREELSITQIFESSGELYFRKQEARHLKELLAKAKNSIIALGGGTPCYGNNMETVLMADAESIYLKASIPELVQRLWPERNMRPLIAHIETKELLTEFIGKHLFERVTFYNEAKYTVNVVGKEREEVARDIRDLLF